MLFIVRVSVFWVSNWLIMFSFLVVGSFVCDSCCRKLVVVGWVGVMFLVRVVWWNLLWCCYSVIESVVDMLEFSVW